MNFLAKLSVICDDQFSISPLIRGLKNQTTKQKQTPPNREQTSGDQSGEGLGVIGELG